MAKGKIDTGDEVLIRALVTGVWADGMVTVHIKSAGQKVTMRADADDIEQITRSTSAR